MLPQFSTYTVGASGKCIGLSDGDGDLIGGLISTLGDL